jgi:two-component system OmpR family sensor kinase
MPIAPRLGRLFWKLLLALSLSMALSMVGTTLYILLTGRQFPAPPRDALVFGYLPIVPLLSGLIAILVISLVLAWYLSRPLRHLRWALRRVAQGHLDTRVLPLMKGRRDEIADLARDFDRMAEQLQKVMESRRILFHDISHELRSPLTRMQAAIGLSRQDPALTDAMLLRIENESGRLDNLIEELLTLHRLEAGTSVMPLERVDLIELLGDITEDADFEARATGRRVASDAQGSFVVDVQGELIYRAFENVIRNAVKYSPPGGIVEVHVQVAPETAALVVTVADRGPGVESSMLETIFEPFFRAEGSELMRGTGLGLAIARRAMLMHGGSVSASLRDGGGLLVTLTLPAPKGVAAVSNQFTGG